METEATFREERIKLLDSLIEQRKKPLILKREDLERIFLDSKFNDRFVTALVDESPMGLIIQFSLGCVKEKTEDKIIPLNGMLRIQDIYYAEPLDTPDAMLRMVLKQASARVENDFDQN